MNRRQLQKLGVPANCVKVAITAVQRLAANSARQQDIKKWVQSVVEEPKDFLEDEHLADLAAALIADRDTPCRDPISYATWGAEGIEEGSHAQMRQACSVPVAVSGALMADAHIGYGLPIGGVLACDNAVIPYAVGVDIACRMKLSLLDIPTTTIKSKFNLYKESLEFGTRFGIGCQYDRPQSHDVMDRDWTVTRITRERKDRAWKQLGTSGSGNHFVEFGVLALDADDEELGVNAGEYVALLSHSGSRGIGAAVCSTYSAIAQSKLASKYRDLSRLAWLDLDSQEGQEYWEAMSLMGHYAAANHDVIHKRVSKRLGAKIIGGVENHHNFAWKETHGGRQVIVHRKGATPAGVGVLGVIPGSMADPAFVVRGRGVAESLASASHGAGRRMSRTKAKEQFTWKAAKKDLEQKGVRVLSAGADEVPGVYKDIRQVMKHQADLVEVVARFDPCIVKMCDDGSKAED